MNNNCLDILNSLIRLPTVSAQGLKTQPFKQAVTLLTKILKTNGFNTFTDTINDNPIIYAERTCLPAGRSSPNKPTILFYNHYDVQPAEPLKEWVSEPFEPVIRSGKLFGRGVSDNKGHFTSRLAAVKTFIDNKIPLPINVKFLLDGAEEIGSPGLAEFIRKYRSKLSADVCIWEYSKSNQKGAPELSLGVKGIVYLELFVKTVNEDLHSSRGIIIPNPAWRLNWALASLKDSQERILIKGFYDDCLKPTDADIKILSPDLLNESKTKKEVGIKKFLLGLSGKPLLRRYFYQPALNINGLTAGYQGPGHKTVLPKQASAKIDFRLVPDQNPDDIIRKLRRHLAEPQPRRSGINSVPPVPTNVGNYFGNSNGFNDIKIISSHGYPPARTRLNHPFMKKYLPMMNRIARAVYGKEFVIEPLSPASGPMYLVTDYLKLPCLAIGIGNPNSNLHAPNENILLSDYAKGIKFLVEMFKQMSR